MKKENPELQIQNFHLHREQINYRCVCANSAISGRGIEENSENFSNLRNLCNNQPYPMLVDVWIK